MKFIIIILMIGLACGGPIRNETIDKDAKNKRLTVNNAPGNTIGSIENFKVVANGPGAVDEIFRPIGSFLSETFSDIFDRPIKPFFQNQQQKPSDGFVSITPIQAETPQVQQSPQIQQNAPSQSASNTNINQNSVSVNSHISPSSPFSVPSVVQSNTNNFQMNAENSDSQDSNVNVNSVQVEANSNPSIVQTNTNIKGNGANGQQAHQNSQNSNSQSTSNINILQSSNPFGENFPFNNNFNPTIINGNIDSIQLSQLNSDNSNSFRFGNNFNPTIINGF